MRPLGSTKHAVGVEWTGRELRWVALHGRPDAWSVTGHGAQPFGLDDLGSGPQRAKVTAWLAEAVRGHRLRGARTVLSVPPERVLVRYMTVPRLPASALRQAMEVEVGSTLHVPFERPVLDVVPVPALGDDPMDETQQPACLVVTDRDLVEPFASIVHQAGLRPMAAEISSLGLWRLAKPRVAPDELTLWLSVDEGQATSAICLGETVYFLRTIADPDRMRISDANLVYLVNDLAYEVERVVNFFNFTLAGRENSLSAVWLHAARHAPEIAGGMAERLQRPVHVIQPVGQSGETSLDPAFYVAAGLALRGLAAS